MQCVLCRTFIKRDILSVQELYQRHTVWISWYWSSHHGLFLCGARVTHDCCLILIIFSLITRRSHEDVQHRKIGVQLLSVISVCI